VLAHGFLDGFARDLGRRGLRLSPAAERALCERAWPGNVRELRNVLERAALLCGHDLLEPEDLRFDGPTGQSLSLPSNGADAGLTLEELERAHIERVLRDLGGRVAEASARLGIPRSTLYQKIKKFNIRT
jgi:DNA-binding NtrC family response regulator